ncbi:hypothetical protein CKAN_02745400 [Cinnamomum micranthum f. kanehirae]|uniref:Uncharacterized protein n=1 Tax=Cinnamomum micranthum f. kanehirae TaxID=337451 RepID=A0A3S3N8P6_9MAGN|nr:hypothetical protein CKAN_02745400 [Cinnamomum micranthum f. kanehirae]
MVISKQQQEGDALPIEMGKEEYVDGFTVHTIIFTMATSNIVPEHEEPLSSIEKGWKSSHLTQYQGF